MRASAFLIAAVLPLAIVTHVAGELGALGLERDVPVLFSIRHAYLLALLLGSLATAVTIVRAEVERFGRRGLARLAAALPYRGEGAAFITLCIAIQAAFFIVTQSLEGSPMSAGDVLFGLAAALASAALSSLAVARFKGDVLRFATRLYRSWFLERRSHVVFFSFVVRPARTARRRWAVLASRANRPPPSTMSIA